MKRYIGQPDHVTLSRHTDGHTCDIRTEHGQASTTLHNHAVDAVYFVCTSCLQSMRRSWTAQARNRVRTQEGQGHA
jgi:hypothetical protein